jgi:class 3 adenylate cyclase|mmetsp:Transcript_9607/g.13117  ORF Transcript_9607/g.13117 Transcript_9607/m.13117 type:complete len:82 (+) Transcript_9607:653-898(+)
MMKRALEESEKLKSEEQKAIDEEEAMLKRVMEESARDEADRLARTGGGKPTEGTASAADMTAATAMNEEMLKQKALLEEKE